MNLDRILSVPYEWSNRHIMLSNLPHRKQVEFALFCAKQVIQFVDSSHSDACIKALKAAEAYMNNFISLESCKEVFDQAAAKIQSYSPQSYAAYYTICAAIHEETNSAHYAGTVAYYVVAYHITKKDSNNKIEEVKAEQMNYMKELIVQSLSREDAECWLLTTSI